MVFILLYLVVIVSLTDARGVSYPKEQCDWIGADRMYGPYLPIGACKHIFNPYNLSTTADDHRYSTKYVCSDDGSSVYSYVWPNNSNCEGDNYHIPPKKAYDDEYFGCSESEPRLCPYATFRFYHQMSPNDDSTCMKSDDGWYSEALNNVYQCLNNSHGWYMLQCTSDGKGLIGIDYTQNCEEKLNETVIYDGCNYKDKYIEIRHCDYWEDGHTETTSAAVTTAERVTTNEPISAVSTALGITSGCDDNMQHMHHMHAGDDHASGSFDDHHDRHHEHHEHHHESSEYDGIMAPPERKKESVLWSRWFMVTSVCGLVFMVLCCCMTYKYYKQKKQIAEFKMIIDEQYNNNKETIEDGEVSTNGLDEGETITFK